MRHLTGHGAPKQWLPAAAGAFFGVIGASRAALEWLVTGWTRKLREYRFNQSGIVGIIVRVASRLKVTCEFGIRRFSTGWGGDVRVEEDALAHQEGAGGITTVFPALRSGPTAVSGASRQKKILSSNVLELSARRPRFHGHEETADMSAHFSALFRERFVRG
jgi:hypothetical protein